VRQDLDELIEQSRLNVARRRKPKPTIDDLLRRVGVAPSPQQRMPTGPDPLPNVQVGPRHKLPSYRVQLDQQEVAALAGVLQADDSELLAAVQDAIARAGVRPGRLHLLEVARRADVLYLTWRRGRAAGDFLFPASLLPVLRATAKRLEIRPLGAAVWNGPSQDQIHRLRWALSPVGMAERMG